MNKKICVICEICVTKKRPKKNLCISVKSVGLFTLSGNIFSSWDYFCPTDFTDYTQIFYGISGESLCPISGGICNDRTGRLCENP